VDFIKIILDRFQTVLMDSLKNAFVFTNAYTNFFQTFNLFTNKKIIKNLLE